MNNKKIKSPKKNFFMEEFIYINYLSSYPNIERALKDGANMHCFLSGSDLRVVIVKKDEQEITYG